MLRPVHHPAQTNVFEKKNFALEKCLVCSWDRFPDGHSIRKSQISMGQNQMRLSPSRSVGDLLGSVSDPFIRARYENNSLGT